MSLDLLFVLGFMIIASIPVIILSPLMLGFIPFLLVDIVVKICDIFNPGLYEKYENYIMGYEKRDIGDW